MYLFILDYSITQSMINFSVAGNVALLRLIKTSVDKREIIFFIFLCFFFVSLNRLKKI